MIQTLAAGFAVLFGFTGVILILVVGFWWAYFVFLILGAVACWIYDKNRKRAWWRG